MMLSNGKVVKMPDKKLTDNEIVKACKDCLHYEACKGTYSLAKGEEDILYDFDGEMYANSGCEDFENKDLINRLQAENERLESYNEILKTSCDGIIKASETYKAEIEKLNAEVKSLTTDKENLITANIAIREQGYKSGYKDGTKKNERLRNAYKQCAWERDMVMGQNKHNCQLAKTEAYKNFAKLLKEKADELKQVCLDGKWAISQYDVDKLLKEKLGERK